MLHPTARQAQAVTSMLPLSLLQGNLTKWKEFITKLNWMPVGIVDVNLPFRFTLSEPLTNNAITLVPLLAYYNENFFNSSSTPQVLYAVRIMIALCGAYKHAVKLWTISNPQIVRRVLCR
jgi:hypothetical protein